PSTGHLGRRSSGSGGGAVFVPLVSRASAPAFLVPGERSLFLCDVLVCGRRISDHLLLGPAIPRPVGYFGSYPTPHPRTKAVFRQDRGGLSGSRVVPGRRQCPRIHFLSPAVGTAGPRPSLLCPLFSGAGKRSV